MDPITIGAIISGIVSAGTAIAQNVTNWNSQKSTNDQNLALQKEAWEREDNAIQRSRADAEKAGFSPLAGLGGSPTSSPIQLQPNSINLDGMTSGLTDSINQIAGWRDRKEAREYQQELQSLQVQSLQADLESKRTANMYQEQQILAGLLQMQDKHNLDESSFAEIVGYLKSAGIIGEDTDLNALGSSLGKDKIKFREFENLGKTADKIDADIAHLQAVTETESTKKDLNKAKRALTIVQAYIAKGDLDAGNQNIDIITLPRVDSNGSITWKTYKNISAQNALYLLDVYSSNTSTKQDAIDAKWNNSPLGRIGRAFRSFK